VGPRPSSLARSASPAVSRSLRDVAFLVGLAAVYLGAAKLGLSLAFTTEQVSVVWPPAGIALAAVLLRGYRVWPAIWLGAFLANVTSHEPVVTASAIAVGNTLEALAGAWLFRRIDDSEPTLDHLKQVIGFVAGAAVASTTIAATVGTSSLLLTGIQPWSAFGFTWWTWWVGDAMAVLIVAPAMLTWATWLRRPTWTRPGEALALMAILVGTTVVAFVGPLASMLSAPPPRFVVFPFVMWAALRFGQRGTATVTLVASAVTIWGTLRDAGAPGAESPEALLFVLQLFLGLVAVSGLLLAAAVTERKGLQDTAQLSEDRLQMALDSAGSGVWTYDVITGTVTWSATLEAIHGLPHGTFGGTFEAHLQVIHPEDREHVARTITASIESGQPYQIEYRIVRPDGSVRSIRERGRAFRDTRGQVVAMTGLCGDTTEHRRAVDALQESEARLKALIESAMDAVLVIDERECITLFNAAAERMFRCRRREVIGTSLERFIPVAARDVHHKHIRQFSATGVTSRSMGAQRILSAVRADGEEFPMEAAISQSTIAGEKVYAVVIRDVTDRVRYEQERDRLLAREQAAHAELEAAGRAKDEFLAVLGHELRNPLGAISNAVTVLNHVSKPDDRTAQPREIITRQARQLGRLLDDLLDTVRLQSGRITLRRQIVDLREITKRCVIAFDGRGEVDAQGLDVTGDPVLVDGDPVRLEQIVVNLVDNAIKYGSPGGRVTVILAREEPEAVLRVQDTGIGIPAADLERIFDRFHQDHGSRGRSSGGLGIGLSLVKGLVGLHAGTVSVFSPAPGGGSEFVVRLPLAAAAGPTTPARAADDGDPSDPRRVLIIEDDPDSREALTILLKLWGHDVEVATEGKGGLERVLNSRPDLTIIDIDLPDLDGYSVARAVRAAPGGASLYLVALTGYGQMADRRRATTAGFDAHLIKPVDLEQLRRLLAAARAPDNAGDATTSSDMTQSDAP
jgi:PAS domain S-box-containing protein